MNLLILTYLTNWIRTELNKNLSTEKWWAARSGDCSVWQLWEQLLSLRKRLAKELVRKLKKRVIKEISSTWNSKILGQLNGFRCPRRIVWILNCRRTIWKGSLQHFGIFFLIFVTEWWKQSGINNLPHSTRFLILNR